MQTLGIGAKPMGAADVHNLDPLQLALRETILNVRIRLEVPVRYANRTDYLDGIASSNDGDFAVELKWKTRAVVAEIAGDRFELVSHGAQDNGRYDFFKDVERVERFRSFVTPWQRRRCHIPDQRQRLLEGARQERPRLRGLCDRGWENGAWNACLGR